MDNNILIDWIKEASAKIEHLDEKIDLKIDKLEEKMAQQHKELRGDVQQNREEFVIFKTKITARTAAISSTIGLIALIASLILNVGSIKDRASDKHNDQIETTN